MRVVSLVPVRNLIGQPLRSPDTCRERPEPRRIAWMAAEDWSADCPFQSGWIARVGDGWPAGRPRSGRPLVAVMEPTDLRDGHHAPKLGRMHLVWLGTVVVERLVWPRGVVVADVAM
jgi:hypothetical protein